MTAIRLDPSPLYPPRANALRPGATPFRDEQRCSQGSRSGITAPKGAHAQRLTDTGPRETPDQDTTAVAVPTLGDYLLHLRKRTAHRRGSKNLSREKVAREVPMSGGYLEKLENNHQDSRERPSLPILQGLARVYELNSHEWRHLCDLASQGTFYDQTGQRQLWDLGGRGVPEELPEPAVFQETITPAMRQNLRADRSGDLVAYLDVRWVLLDANDAYQTTMPGHKIGMSIVEWYFSQEAKDQLLDWRTEVSNAVAWWRGVMGKFQRSQWATDLHRRLGQYPEFSEFWEASEVLMYWREQGSQMHLRVPDNTLQTLNVDYWIKLQELPIIEFRGRPGPFTGLASDRACGDASRRDNRCAASSSDPRCGLTGADHPERFSLGGDHCQLRRC